MFCPIGQNELDINECDAQIPHIIKNLRSPNEVRGNNRLTAVIEDTLYYKQTPILNQEAIKKWSICRKEKRIQESICTVLSGTGFYSNKKYFQIS